jgi:teichuronic acid biosynthesis glycosyltransferase TuaG
MCMIGQTSVIIPCYNRHEYLEETLKSVRSQTRPVREIIVVDDGSTTPVQAPREWDGPPLRIVRTENRGVSAARNFGISLATGNFIAFLDSDDAWAPTKIEMQEDALSSSSDCVAVFTHRTEKPGWRPCPATEYPPPDASDDLFWRCLWKQNFITVSSVMVRRETLLRVGGFNENLRYCEDLELWFRLLRAGRFAQISLPLSYRRIHPGQMTTNFDEIAVHRRKWRLIVMREHGMRLAAAGISVADQNEEARREYREDLVILYFQRRLSTVRPLLWAYLLRYPGDRRMLKYAFLSALPARLLTFLRDSSGTTTEPVHFDRT